MRHTSIETLAFLVLLLSKLVLLSRARHREMCLDVPSVTTCDGGTFEHFREWNWDHSCSWPPFSSPR